MAGRVEGKVAFLTGAARGQGRAHAVRLDQEGADIVAVAICKKIDTVDLIAASTPEDLAETADLVKGHNRRIYTAEVDVRDYDALKAAVDTGVPRGLERVVVTDIDLGGVDPTVVALDQVCGLGQILGRGGGDQIDGVDLLADGHCDDVGALLVQP